MNATIAVWLERFDERSLRERLLISAAILAFTWVLWDVSLGSVVTSHKNEVATSVEQLTRELKLQTNEYDRLLAEDTAPQKTALEQQQTRLQALIVEQQSQLDDLLARFVPPEEVPHLLEDVLQDYRGLKLIRLSSKPAEPLLLQSQSQEKQETNPITLYRHPVELEFEGGYLDVIAYLTALENASWGLSWRKLEYAVLEYPNAAVLIEIETLSREKEWLGV